MGGETVPQRVRSDPLVDVRGLGGLDDDAVELARADMGRCALSGQEPAVGTQNALLPPDAPPSAQEKKKSERGHGMAASSAERCRGERWVRTARSRWTTNH